jgi:DNA-binding transcriptional LysR family regulator
MDRLASMRVFAEVARTGTFAAAAERLQMSRAMATKHIMRLENALGVRLLNRTTRRLSLTEVGRAYLDRCVQILAEVEEAEQAVTQLSSRPRGVLKLTAPVNFGAFHLARAAAAYMQRYPDVKIEITLHDRFVDLIEEGIDLAIRISAHLSDSSYIARELATARRVVCASPEYLDRHGVPQIPEDLVHHNCLRYGFLLPADEWPFCGPDGVYTLRVSGNLKANVGDPLRVAAIQGLGLVMQPTYMVGLDIKEGRLKVVLSDYEAPGVAVYGVYPHRKHLSEKVRSFVDFLVERFHPHPYWDDWTQ